MEELVKMSPKGQLVVPRDIRKQENFKPTDRFVAVRIKEGVVFKRVKIPNIEAEFKSLSKEISQHFKRRGINGNDLKGAIKWARKSS